VLDGLAPFGEAEVERVLGGRARVLPGEDRTAVRIAYQGPLAELLELRTVVAAYLLTSVEGRRPSALLGDERLFDQVEAARRLHPPGAFSSFRLSVPGAGSAAVGRLREELAARTGLADDPDGGELLLRIRRAHRGGTGWDLLTRLSPRPLSARSWRVWNLPGALNATIAAVMVELSRPRPSDRVLNLMCGSGTLLVERLLRAPAGVALGCDLDQPALHGARANLDAAGLAGTAALASMDATRLALPDGRFDVVLADLPYGHRMGSHEANAMLYPAVLEETARVTAPGAAFLALTHELKLFERCLEQAGGWWRAERAVQVFQKGHHPVIHLLRRRPGTARRPGPAGRPRPAGRPGPAGRLRAARPERSTGTTPPASARDGWPPRPGG
jgi:tRNA (guanine6-N2)-methyltransferase